MTKPAKVEGFVSGLKPKAMPDNFDGIATDFAKCNITAVEAAEWLGVSKSLLYKWVNERGIKHIEYFKIKK